MDEIKKGSIKRLLKRVTGIRVGDNGAEATKDAVEAYASQIGTRAKDNAIHAGRTTINEDDVILALEQIQNG